MVKLRKSLRPTREREQESLSETGGGVGCGNPFKKGELSVATGRASLQLNPDPKGARGGSSIWRGTPTPVRDRRFRIIIGRESWLQPGGRPLTSRKKITSYLGEGIVEPGKRSSHATPDMIGDLTEK